jgi:hypothetical protein
MKKEIKEKSLKLHKQRLLDEEIKKAATDLWLVDLEVNSRLEKLSIAKTQLEFATEEMNLVEKLKLEFLDHRDIERFKNDLTVDKRKN